MNGHTGGFTVSRDELRDTLRRINHRGPVGWPLLVDALSHEVAEGLSAGAIIALIEQFSGRDVYVEEQDYDAFILHVDYDVDDPTRAPPTGEKWLMVEASSPFYGPLRTLYQRELARRYAPVDIRAQASTGEWTIRIEPDRLTFIGPEDGRRVVMTRGKAARALAGLWQSCRRWLHG